MDIGQYEYLWTNENYEYVLVKGDSGYSIENRISNEFLLLENEKLMQEIVEKMLFKGVPVYESGAHLMNHCPPINIVGQPTRADDFPVKRYKLLIAWSNEVPLYKQVKELKKLFPVVRSQSDQQLLNIARSYGKWQFDVRYLEESQKNDILEAAKAHGLCIVFELDELREDY